jgi:hypothetical protein
MENYVMERFRPAVVYFNSHFVQVPTTGNDNCFGHLLPVWKAFALANPCYLRRTVENLTEQTAHDADASLAAIKNFVKEELDGLVVRKRLSAVEALALNNDLGPYLDACAGVDYTTLKFHDAVERCEEFWKRHLSDCATWASFAHLTYLHQPSTGATERCNSIVNRMLRDDNSTSLDDVIQAAVYSKYAMLDNLARVKQEAINLAECV